MTTKNRFKTHPVNRTALAIRMLIGATIALAVILTFVLGAEGNPEWGKYWKIRPLIITPMAGAMGGMCYYLLDYYFGHEGGWKKWLAKIVGVVVFIIGLWIGVVLGLDGTMWD